MPQIITFPVASSVPFDNDSNGFTSTDVQSAIEEAQQSNNQGNPVGWLQYTNTTLNTTTARYPSFSVASMDENYGSFANSFFTKPNNTDFITSYAGFVKISYKVEMQNDDKDRSFMAVIVKNNAALDPTKARNIAEDKTNRYGSVAGTFVISCAPGDVFRLGFTNTVGNSRIRIFPQGGTFLLEAYYLS